MSRMQPATADGRLCRCQKSQSNEDMSFAIKKGALFEGRSHFLGIRDSGVSQHLALLRKDGLVAARRNGQTIWYSIASAEARALLVTLYGIYCEPTATCDMKPARKTTRPARRRV